MRARTQRGQQESKRAEEGKAALFFSWRGEKDGRKGNGKELCVSVTEANKVVMRRARGEREEKGGRKAAGTFQCCCTAGKVLAQEANEKTAKTPRE